MAFGEAAYGEVAYGEAAGQSGSNASGTASLSLSASGATGATEPFDAVGRLLPSGVTNSSGGGPSHGASTLVSYPRRRMLRARASTWPCTPPGMVRL